MGTGSSLDLAEPYYYRAAELSADRASTLVVRDPQIVCRMLMVAASGLPADQVNLDAFMAQALEYESWDAPSDRVRRFFSEINITHPYAVRRVSEVMRWVQSGEYGVAEQVTDWLRSRGGG